MEVQELPMIEDVIVSCENVFDKLSGENRLELVGGDETGEGNLADEVLEDMEEYWEDINDRMIISRMVSNSVIKGMVTAVGQEAAETVATKELEVANLKQHLQCREVETANYGRFSSCIDACEKHDKMREDLNAFRNVAREQFEQAKKEIDCGRGFNSITEMLECLNTTVNTVCTKVDDILLSSKIKLCEGLEERDLSRELENTVTKTVLKSSQEEFEVKLWDQNAQFCGIHNVNWVEKFADVSSLRTQLDSIIKSLSISETGLVSPGHDLEHLHHKAFTDHVTSTSLYEENKTLEESNTHVHESYDFQQLKHMSKEELVNYFNIVMTKMRRDHESALHQKIEKYFRLKREYLKERGSPVSHRKDQELDVLRKKLPEIILKLEDFLLQNEKLPTLFNSVEDRLKSLLSENRWLTDCLTDKKNEVNVLEDSNMRLLVMQEIYDIILRTAAIPAETTAGYEIEDSEIESLIMQELSGMIFKEAIKDAGGKLTDLHQVVQIEKEFRIYLEKEALEKENKLRLEVEEKERSKQEILALETALIQKEKVANDLSILMSKEREQFELAYRELTALREHASQHQTLAAVSNKELELLRAQLSEALEQIEIDKMETGNLNQELDQIKEVVTESRKERSMAFALAQEKHDMLLFNEAREEKLREGMEMATNNIHELTKKFDDFERKIPGALEKNNIRLEDATCHLKTLTKMANALERTGVMYKERMEGRYADLQMAEAEVDLLGDEVDTLLRLLEKIYIVLDHYSPILKHYPGIIEILELVRRELSGESTKLSRSIN